MIKIRLTRTGKKGEPHYRVIVIKAREKRDGNAIEYLGYYNPRTNPSTFDVDKDRIKHWLSVGAQPSDTVARLLAKQGLYEMPKKEFKKKPGKKKQARAAAKAEATAKTEEKKSA